MRRLPGQALRLVPRLVTLALSFSVAVGLVLAALAWRLSQGPIPIPQVTERIEAALNRPGVPARISIGSAELAWDGWREGVSPFEIVIRQVRVLDETGRVRADLPEASVSLAYRWLLLGRVAPRRIELTGLRLRAYRAADGGFTVDLGGLAAAEEDQAEATAGPGEGEAEPFLQRLLAGLSGGPGDGSPLGALERVTVHDARIQVSDAQLGTEWSLDRAELELHRHEARMDIEGRATLTLGEERLPARLRGVLEANPTRLEGTLAISDVRPALLARQAPALAGLAALDATASIELRAGGQVDGRGASLAALLQVGPGLLRLGDGGEVAISGADISLLATPTAARIERAVLRLAPAGGAAAPPLRAPLLSLVGEARRHGEQWQATLRAHLDAISLADLDAHWPRGIAPGARNWLTQNISAGTARNGNFAVDARMGADLAGFSVTALRGTLEAQDVTAHWLRPIAPVVGVNGTAEFGLDGITVRVTGGRQQGTGLGIREGTLRFVNLDRRPGEADFDIRMAGPLPDVLSIVRHPRLHIVDRARVAIPEMSGTVQDLRLRIGFPLLAEFTMDDVRMQTEARVADLRVPRAILGRDLDRGNAEVRIDMEGLNVQGQGNFTDIAVRVGVEMDFRRGPAGQLLSRETLTGRADVRQIAALGLDLRDFAEGPVTIDARNESRRGQPTRATIRGDLRDARVFVGPLAWQKPRGAAGTVETVLRLQGDQVQAIEQLRIEAGDAMVRARGGAFRHGWPERLEVLEAIIGGTRFSGDARAPRNPGGEWAVSLRGTVLDLAAALADRGEPDTSSSQQGSGREGSPPAALDWRFDRVVLGEGRFVTALTGQARLDAAGVLRSAEADARFGSAGAQLRVSPDGNRRRVTINSDDGGTLLRLLDVVPSIQGGRLAVDAQYESSRPGAPLTGTAEMSDFSIRNAPGFAKLLQAMTLYGLVDALSGPGLNFNRLIAPFRLTRETLELDDARAFSASLGLTARGRLDRRRSQVEMEGTIVPAYFFNQILGNIPLFGRLFSPEAGGGLFAATYRLRGPLGDPNVTVNPLAALTPGFLRGIFQIGQEGQQLSPQVQGQGARSRRQPQQAPAGSPPAEPLRGPPAH